VLAGTPAITNTGPTAISGSVGISPAASVTGFGGAGNGTVTNGTIQAGTAAATTAKSDLTAAYGVAKSSPCNVNETGVNLGGKVLTPGTYCQTTAPTLTGILTLSGNGVFIFQEEAPHSSPAGWPTIGTWSSLSQRRRHRTLPTADRVYTRSDRRT
jgi:hypothetical protein